MCHWWSSLWVKVKTHNCIDGANDVPGYFYLNWDIFCKWNAFKINCHELLYLSRFQCVMVTSCCGYAHHCLIQLLTCCRSLIYSHHHVQHTLKYLHTARSCRFYPYRQPLTHLHCSIYTIIPMPMKQPWRIWVFKPQKSSITHKSNQTKHNKIMCVLYGLYCITGV